MNATGLTILRATLQSTGWTITLQRDGTLRLALIHGGLPPGMDLPPRLICQPVDGGRSWWHWVLADGGLLPICPAGDLDVAARLISRTLRKPRWHSEVAR